jgi:hypothetical protein
MIEREVLGIMYNSMDRIISHFQERFGLHWAPAEESTIVEANLLRNCIVHNNGVVDPRLSAHGGRWTEGSTIALTPSDVHQFGIAARRTARNLYAQAEQKFPGPVP